MYPVTSDYIATMDQNQRPAVSCELDIIRLDGALQAVTTAKDLSGVPYNNVLSVDAAPVVGIATLEQHYMRMDREHVMDSSPYYMGDTLSADTPDSDGLYPITACGLVLSFDAAYERMIPGPNTVTVVTDGAIAKIQAVQGTFSATYTADGDTIVIDGLPGGAGPPGTDPLTLTVTATKGPNRRAHIHRVYMGEAIRYSSREVISLNYVDINDGLCLELPKKSVSVSVANFGTFDAEAEYTNPTFRRFYTRGMVRLSFEHQYTIPLGTFYLDTYTVDSDKVDFNFVGPLAVLNEFTHWWSKVGIQNASVRIKEVVSPGLQLSDIVTDRPVETAAEQFGILADTDYMSNALPIVTPPPPVSGAQVIQLVCNLTGNQVRQCRVPQGPSYDPGKDLYVCMPSVLQSPRQLAYDYIYTYQWDTPDRIGLYTAESTTFSGIQTAELTSNYWVYVTHDSPVYSPDLPISGATVPDPDGLGVQLKAIFGYCAYYRSRNDSGPVGAVKANLYKEVKSTKSVSYGEGTEKKLSNPLLRDHTGSVATGYISRMHDELQYNLCCTLSHRGHPELDAGDIITVQYKKSGSYVNSRVLENRITIKNGVMRGSTKVRRMA